MVRGEAILLDGEYVKKVLRRVATVDGPT